MRRLSLAIVLATASCFAAAASKTEIEGTWAYSEQDAVMEIRLDANGDCLVAGSSEATHGVGFKCRYTLQWPDVYIQAKLGDRGEQLHLVLVGDGASMRVEGEGRRSLHRVWDAPPPLPPATDLGKPGAMADLEQRDPQGYRTVGTLIDIVQNHGCRGAYLGEIKKLVRWDLISCPSAGSPPENSHVEFWLGDNRYFIDIPPR
jgi:hypothetical protein